jgi:hypothetical protein
VGLEGEEREVKEDYIGRGEERRSLEGGVESKMQDKREEILFVD